MLLKTDIIEHVKNDPVKLHQLSMETTRRCNLACAHCYKGDADAIDSDPEIPGVLFNYFQDVDFICLQGAEPFMNTEGLRQINTALKENKVSFGSFSFVTNGTILDEEFLDILEDIHDKSDKNKNIYGVDGWRYWTGVSFSVSNDGWHEDALKAIGLTRKDVENNYLIMKEKHPRLGIRLREYIEKTPVPLVPAGRSKNVGGRRPLVRYKNKTLSSFFVEKGEPFKDFTCADQKTLTEFQVNARGDVMNSWMSNDESDKALFGNILKQPIPEILIKHAHDDLYASHDC